MKRVLVFITLISVLLLCSCISKKTESVSVEEPELQVEIAEETAELDISNFNQQLANSTASHSFLDETMVGAEITITGLLNDSLEEGFILKENPSSRNVVTFKLEADQDSKDAYLKLPEFCSKTVTIRGTLTEATSIWTKSMTVLEIISE